MTDALDLSEFTPFVHSTFGADPSGPLPFQRGDRVRLDLANMAHHSKAFCRQCGIEDPKAVYTVESCYWSSAEASPRWKLSLVEVEASNLEVSDFVLVNESTRLQGINEIIDDYKLAMEKLGEAIEFQGEGDLLDLRDEAWTADDSHIWWGEYSEDWDMWDHQEYHTGTPYLVDDLVVYKIREPYIPNHLVFRQANGSSNT